MAELFTPSWDNVVSPERAELVFANRQKEYGAYQLRRSYQKNIARALIFSVLFFTLCISAPVIYRFIAGSMENTNTKPIEVEVTLTEPPPIDEKEPPPPPPPPPPPTIETVKFTPPVVVDRPIEEEQPPPQEKLSETTVSSVTQEGEVGGTEPMPEVVVEDPDAGKVFTYVEEMPAFPGGDGARQEFLQKNLKYPAMAREANIEGTVYIGFVVDKDGKLKDFEIKRGVNGLSDEAMRVAKMMPAWTVGKQNGRAVQVSMVMPIKFTLAK